MQVTAFKHRYRAEDLPSISRDGDRFELVDGDLWPLSPAGGKHASVTMRFAAYAFNYVSANDLGECFTAEPGCKITSDPDTILAPDWAFIARDRLPDPLPDGFITVIPDAVMEARSPGDRPGEIAIKRERWLSAGVRLLWEIDPVKRTVTAWGPAREARILSVEDTLSGEDVLPGFAVPVARLFRGAQES